MEYVREIRLTTAARALLVSNDNVNDIAYEVGFSSPLYYYRVFEKWNVTTPNRYRRKLHELKSSAKETIYYNVETKKEDLEHFIAFHFAKLQVPELWLSPFVPYNGLPIESDVNFILDTNPNHNIKSSKPIIFYHQNKTDMFPYNDQSEAFRVYPLYL